MGELLKDNADLLLGALLSIVIFYTLGSTAIIPAALAGIVLAVLRRFFGFGAVMYGALVVMLLFFAIGFLSLQGIIDRVASVGQVKLPFSMFNLTRNHP